MLKKIEYKSTAPGCAEIFVNGFKLSGVSAFNFDHQVDSVPEVHITLRPLAANISQLADLHLAFDISSLKDAVDALKLYAQIDDGFVDAAALALLEAGGAEDFDHAKIVFTDFIDALDLTAEVTHGDCGQDYCNLN